MRRRPTARRDARVVYISSSQNLAALIDNVYGTITSREASGLMRAIDEANREGEDPKRAAIAYLREIGVTVRVTEDPRDARRRRDPSSTFRPGQPVEVNKILGGGRHLLRHWSGGYVFVRMRSPQVVVLRHTEGLYEGLEVNEPLEDIRVARGSSRDRRRRRRS